jgi:DUF1009 family protein
LPYRPARRLPRCGLYRIGGSTLVLANLAGSGGDAGDAADHCDVPWRRRSVGHYQPSESHHADIALGLALVRAIGRFDVGQATVVAGNHVLAVEAAEGTDEMLSRVAELRRKGRIRSSGGVLVKAPKPGQDRRIDLPTIGPQTIAGAARAGLAGIAVVSGEAIIAEPDSVAQAADRERIFIVGVRQVASHDD